MKRNFRLLSTLLTTFMVLSMITSIPVSAADTSENTFFCDFESFPATGETESTTFTANGFKWMSVNDATLEEDETHGKVLTATNILNLGFGFDTPVTTGKVRLGFSFKAETFGDVYGVQEMGTTSSNSKGAKRFLHLRATSSVIDASSEYGLSALDFNLSGWNFLEVVVDLDEDTYSVYSGGKLIKSIDYEMTQLQGFYFNNGGKRNPYGAIDNIALSYEAPGEKTFQVVSSEVTEGADGVEIAVGFSESLALSGIAAHNVTVTKCGGTETVEVTDVSFVENRVVIVCADDFEAGCEYAITFSDDVKSVYGKSLKDGAYVYIPLTDIAVPYTSLKDFEDSSVDVTTYKNILNNNNNISGQSSNTGLLTTTVDSSKVGNSGASGSALGITGLGTWARLLDVIATDVGVENYEFDFKFSGCGYNGSTQFRIYATDSTTELYRDNPIDDMWKHMKMVFDTEKNELKIYVNGELSKTIPNFELSGKLRVMIYTATSTASASLFEIDNYESYVETKPLNLKSVRYTDFKGNVTGANIINAETTQIDLTFSEVIDAATVSGITLTAGTTPITIDEDNIVVDGSKVTLPIPGMLPGNADIELTIPTTIASELGNVLSTERVYNIATKAGKFEISDLALTVNGSTVTTPGTTGAAGDEVLVTAVMANTAAETGEVAVVYAFYNDNELVDVAVNYFEIPEDSYVTNISEAFTTKANVSYDTVKAFIWDNFANAQSLAVAASYPAN